ncbi:5681_t:CDS:10 [Gigaspora rosea]|nr:5681_t:CDS:10 [Gigaspora rosea]
MFLQWISGLRLLDHNPESNVLAKFPLNVRKALISEITSTLLQAHDPNLLSSITHVKWVMEAIGQGFALPLEEMPIITANSKELYSQWLFEPNSRPAAIRNATGQQEEQEFWQIIFHHYSLLFQPRVLIVLTMAGRTLGPQFSEETWLVLLKVVLGITDLLFELWLRSRIRKVEMWNIFKKCFNQWTHRHQAILQWNATTLALTQRVVRLLYGPKEGADMVNVSVGGYNVGLDLPTDFVYFAWHRMVYLINNPCTLPSSNFSLAISGIDFLQDTSCSFFSIPDGNTLLNMFGPWLFQACMMNRPDPGTQNGRAVAFGVLCKIFCLPQKREKFLRNYVTQFYLALIEGLRIDTCLPTILMSTTSLFATELEGVRMMVPDFVVGIRMILPKLAPGFKIDVPLEDLRLAAIRVASTIMCLPNHFEKVPMRENWNFGLHQNGDKLVSNDDEIMVNELMRVLYSEDEGDISKKEKKPEPFTALKFYILELLLKSLKTEKSTYNLRYLLHLINVYVVEDVAFCPGLNCARELVLEFCRYIDTMLSGAYGGLSITFNLVERAYDCMMRWILIGQWIVGDRDCYEAVISTISKGISIIPNNDDENAQPSSPVDKKKNRKEPIPNKLFAPRGNKMSTANNENNLQAGGQHRYGKKGEMAVKLAAEIAMSQFVNHLGNFPAWSDHIGPSRVSTLFNDDLLLAKAHIAESNVDSIPELVRYFLIDGRVVIGFVEIPKHPIWLINKDSQSLAASDNLETPVEAGTPVSTPGTPKAPIPQTYTQKELDEVEECPSVIIVMRNSTGKYSWESHMCYKPPIGDNSKVRPLSPEIDKDFHEPALLSPLQSFPILRTETPPHFLYDQQGTKDQSFIQRVLCFNDDQIPTVNNIFEAGSDSWRAYSGVKKLTQRQKEIEVQAFEERKHVKFDHQNPQVFRLFMSQMGLLSLENRHRVIPLHISEKVISDIEKLDLLNERNCLSVSVYYIQSGSDDFDQIINPPSISEDFERFLNSLGWPVSLDTHSGYKAKLDSSICKVAPYFADRSVEVIFNVPYLIKTLNTDSSSNSLSNFFKNIFADDLVCIVWIEDVLLMHSAPSKIGQHAFVYIFVHPLQNATGLYWIRIITSYSCSIGIGSGLNNEKKTGKGRVNWNADVLKLNENHLAFGPLVDGMIVSRHTIGSLVRNTAISAHDACRNLTETRIRQPYAIRRQFIDEMYNKYKTSLSITE